jgi:hypothetical protein
VWQQAAQSALILIDMHLVLLLFLGSCSRIQGGKGKFPKAKPKSSVSFLLLPTHVCSPCAVIAVGSEIPATLVHSFGLEVYL